MSVTKVDGGLLTIGSVLALLQDEFSDVEITISKIRFLEAEGIVVPARTPTGYRKFSPSDVDRLRYTLRMQRDHFLPLRVIRDNLQRSDEAAHLVDITDGQLQLPSMASGPHTDSQSVPSCAATAVSTATAVPAIELSIHELSRQTGLDIKDLRELEKTGFLFRIKDSDAFGPDALQIGKVVAALQARGLGPRHLRPAVVAAANQVELIDSLMETRRLACRSNQELSDLKSEARDIANLNLKLQAILIRAGLNGSI